MSQATFKLMEIMLISARMWIFQYLWYWPKVEPIKMQISAKWKVSENRESLTDRGFPSNSSSLSAQRKMSGNMWWRATLPFEFWAPGLNIVLCAEPFVMLCVAVKNRMYWWHVSIVLFYVLCFLFSLILMGNKDISWKKKKLSYSQHFSYCRPFFIHRLEHMK